VPAAPAAVATKAPLLSQSLPRRQQPQTEQKLLLQQNNIRKNKTTYFSLPPFLSEGVQKKEQNKREKCDHSLSVGSQQLMSLPAQGQQTNIACYLCCGGWEINSKHAAEPSG